MLENYNIMKVITIMGNDPHQFALACKLHEVHPIASAVAIAKPRATSRRSLATRAVRRVVAGTYGRAWRRLQARYLTQYSDFPAEDKTIVTSANSHEVFEVVRRVRPDLVLVSGTDLLREEVIGEISKSGRILNLHTGISPYIRGGPNCTNWALALDRPDLIGSTMMWLDAGIDTGAIVATERTPLAVMPPLVELHWQVMEHAHDLYMRTFEMATRGQLSPGTPQASLDAGRLFLTKHWTLSMMLLGLRNHRRLCQKELPTPNVRVRLVPLEGTSLSC